jgi:hypothetical protein
MGTTYEARFKVGGVSPSSETDMASPKVNLRREVCIIDFLTQMANEGRMYNVQAGTITTPLTGDIKITDTKAEMSTDADTGYVVIPVYLGVDLESFAGCTLP